NPPQAEGQARRSVAVRRRRSSNDQLSASHRPRLSRNIGWSSPRKKFFCVIDFLESQHGLGHDVALHLVGAAVDRELAEIEKMPGRPGGKASRLVGRTRRKIRAGPLREGTRYLHGEFGQALAD